MRFLHNFLLLSLAFVATSSFASAQTYDELLSENEQLRQRIEALETRFDVRAGSDRSLVFWQDDHHEHEHEEHEHFEDEHDHGYSTDHVEYGHDHRHGTIEGYPYIHLFKTEHAFLEDKVQFDAAWSSGADDGLVDETEAEIEFFRALNSRWGVILEIPVVQLDPMFDSGESGIGDIETGVQFVAFNGDYSILSFGLNVGIPTGDEDRGLGSGHATIEPKMFVLYDFGGGTLFQGEAFFEIPLDVADPENEFVYNFGVSHTFAQTCDWHCFRWLSPTLELNSVTVLNGPDSGDTVVNITPGLRWIVLDDDDQFGFAWSLPITGSRDYDTQFLLSYLWHY